MVRCAVKEQEGDIQDLTGIGEPAQFSDRYPPVANALVAELQACFKREELITVEGRLSSGEELTVATGALAGMSAQGLKNLPRGKKVQILLDRLAKPPTVKVGCEVMMLKKRIAVDLAPFLAVPAQSAEAASVNLRSGHQAKFSAGSGVGKIRLRKPPNEQVRSLANSSQTTGKDE